MIENSRYRLALWITITVGLAVLAYPTGWVKAAGPYQALSRFEQSIKRAIADVRPAVVSIRSTQIHRDGNQNNDTGEANAVPYQSIGSGVIVDPKGLVVTNAHVVKGASRIIVKLWRAREVELVGQLVHLNEKQDLAILRLIGNGPYPYAHLAASGSAKTGDWVIAIGSPFGLKHSVSMGVVSNDARNLVINGREYLGLIQTDAAINQGNSGGALINLNGQVVGINTAIYAPRGVFAGVGFAIPSSTVWDYFRSATGSMMLGHTVAAVEKEPIRPGDKAPHDPLGLCTNCHTFIIPPKSPITTVQLIDPRATLAAVPHATGFRTVKALASQAGLLSSQSLDTSKSSSGTAGGSNWDIILRAGMLVMASATVFNMLGVGGGFIYVPLLLFLGINFHVASATSLFIITSAHLSALYVYFRSRLVDLKLALMLEPITCLGAFMGGISSSYFSETSLSLIFGCFLFLSSYLMHRKVTEGQVTPVVLYQRFCWFRSFGSCEYVVDLSIAMPVCLFIGYIGGVLGVAGGILKIPMLVIFLGLPIKVAIATSSLMVTFTSTVGCLGHSLVGHFKPDLAISLAVMAILGAQIGARFTIRADRNLLKQLFALLLLVVGIWMIARVI